MHTREQLLGYLLGALDQDEHQEIARSLQEQPQLRLELELLREQLTPLANYQPFFAPPAGLANRVLDELPQPSHASVPRFAARAGMNEFAEPTGAWNWSDSIVVAAVILAAMAIFLPAINESRALSQQNHCQYMLTLTGHGMHSFAQQASDGRIPSIQMGDGSAFPARPLLLIQDEGYMPPIAMLCPASPQAGSLTDLATLAELDALDEAEQAVQKARMCGSYAYPLGMQSDDKIVGARIRYRTHFTLMSDSPRWTDDHQLRTVSHRGRGSNVLYEDGSVQFCVALDRMSWTDDPFANRAGIVAPGLDPEDAVLGGAQLIRVAR